MAGGTTEMSSATRAMRAATLLSMVVYHVAGQETCSSVTVTGGEFPGVYELGTGSSADTFLGTADGSTQVLQAVAFGESRARRNLGGDGGSRRRGLANDCSNQMWILADTSTVTAEGFPYYSTFDCATHPASVESTWLLVDCDDCAEVAPISVVCTAGALGSGDGDGSTALALPAIIGIAAGGLVLLLCLGFCFSRHKKRAHKGSHTFADDSEHSMAQQKSAAGGAAVVGAPNDASVNGSRGPLPAYSEAVGETVESPLGPGAAAGGGSGGLGLISKGANAKSFKPTHGPNNPAYEGIFATRSSAGGGGGGNSSQGGHSVSTMAHPPAVEMRSKFASPEMLRKDSMAAAAAAAASASATSRSQGGSGMHDVEMNSPGAFGNVLSSGVVEGRASRGTPPQQRQQQQPPSRAARGAGLEGAGAGDGGGITWSAGQNLNHRRGGFPGSEFGGDSAAGSVYELQPPDDEDLEHTYHDEGCNDSVAASSPGAYSMYSHYTAGGGMYGGGGPGDTWSSDEGGGLRPDDRVGGGGIHGGGGGGAGRQGTSRIPSPATLGARNGLRGTPPGGAGGAGNSRR